MSRKQKGLQQTYQVRLYPTPEQGRLLIEQALRDARSVFARSLDLDVLPVLKKPICQWNNQNWHIKGNVLIVPISLDGKVQQLSIRCAVVSLAGLPGILRVKKKRGKWVADITMTLPKPKPVEAERVM